MKSVYVTAHGPLPSTTYHDLSDSEYRLLGRILRYLKTGRNKPQAMRKKQLLKNGGKP